MKKIKILSVSVSLFLFVSCVTAPVGIVPSNIPLNDRKIVENLGQVKSSDTAFSIIGLWMIGRPDFDSAIRSAIDQKNGDALINISIYQTYSYFILFSLTTVSVEGEAVKLSPLSEKKDDRKK